VKVSWGPVLSGGFIGPKALGLYNNNDFTGPLVVFVLENHPGNMLLYIKSTISYTI
jgi:hypothetical protein